MLRVFSDYHHSSLFYSLQLLFEHRLGGEIYRPIGMDWWENKFWAINNLEPTAKQYLETGRDAIPKDGTPPLNLIDHIYPKGIYSMRDTHNNTENKAITLDQFKEMDIDIVIASLPQHIPLFKKLIQIYKPKAKFIFQMGNRFTNVINDIHMIPNLMASIKPFSVPPSCNALFYRQEFPLDIFKPSGLPPEKLITSFINVYHENGGFQNYLGLKGLMPNWNIKSYGGQCQDGTINGIDQMAAIMQRSAWGFHIKSGADGYGHCLHNFFSVGTPVIINYEEYKKELGGDLLISGETCLSAEVGQDMTSIASEIGNMSPEKYSWMRQRVKERFDEIVDFDKDEIATRQWLSKLL